MVCPNQSDAFINDGTSLSIVKFVFNRAEVEEFFANMDRDFDGKLSFVEFMGEETPLEKLFKSMDIDQDGVVTKEVGGTAHKIQFCGDCCTSWSAIYFSFAPQ